MWFIEIRWFDIDGQEIHRSLFPHEGETEEQCQGWQRKFNSASWEAYSQAEGDLTTIEVRLRDLGSLLDSEAKKKFLASLEPSPSP